MDNNPIFTDKNSYYCKFKIVCLMIKDKKVLTLSEKLETVELCYNMNKKGTRRKLNKDNYVTLLKNLCENY
jgi:hypothetical protein